MSFVLSFLLSLSAFGDARTIIIRPGVSQTLNRQQFRNIPNQEIIVQCEDELKCTIGYEYVGKKFSLVMPNGKNYAFYKTKKEAMSAAGDLVSAKICEQVVLNVDNQKMASH